jgi:hypothetical protein
MGYEQMEGFRAVGIVAADSGLWNYEFDDSQFLFHDSRSIH